MPRLARACEVLFAALLIAGPAAAARPHFAVVDPLTPDERRVFDADKVETLPTWGGTFSVKDKSYKYRFVGAAPSGGGTTSIRTFIVPIRLVVPDPTHPDAPPIVFDAAPIVPHITASPMFSPSLTGRAAQFADAMLRAEFPSAPADWHTLLQPVTGPTLAITMQQGSVVISRAKSGRLFGYILDSKSVNQAIAAFLHRSVDPHTLPIFITYNSVKASPSAITPGRGATARTLRRLSTCIRPGSKASTTRWASPRPTPRP